MASFKGFMKGLGKIALQAAPYVAAPFTGGASLYAVPATQKLGQKWAEHDAKKNIEKGIAPSKFDKYLGMASNVASLASGTGALGKFGSAAYTGVKAANAANTAKNVAKGASTAKKVADTAKTVSSWQDKLKTGMDIYNATRQSPSGGSSFAPGEWDWMGGGIVGQQRRSIFDEMNQRNNENLNWDWGGGQSLPPANRQQQPISPFQYGMQGMAIPQGYNPVRAGQMDALRNQPWRAGATIQTQGPDDSVITSQTPPIYPQYQEQQPQFPMFADAMTPRFGRRRNPEPEAAEYQ